MRIHGRALTQVMGDMIDWRHNSVGPKLWRNMHDVPFIISRSFFNSNPKADNKPTIYPWPLVHHVI